MTRDLDTTRGGTPSIPVRRPRGRPPVVIYAAAAGLAAAVPVPLLDGMLAALARGAAMRRVASRHGILLSREARRILAEPGSAKITSSEPARLLRNVAQRFLPPLRIASRAEDALATIAASVLLDHYLETSPRGVDQPLGAAEAQRVRNAIDAAVIQGTVEGFRSIPQGVLDTVMRAGRAAREGDEEGRNVLERLLDTLLDGFADAPEGLRERLCERFDLHLQEAR